MIRVTLDELLIASIVYVVVLGGLTWMTLQLIERDVLAPRVIVQWFGSTLVTITGALFLYLGIPLLLALPGLALLALGCVIAVRRSPH